MVDFQSEQCIGCGYCITGCPFDIPPLHPDDNRRAHCKTCVARVVVGREQDRWANRPTGGVRRGGRREGAKRVACTLEEGETNKKEKGGGGGGGGG
ncbi:4Fe-4S binding protein, partial [Escherichia coli]|uniref:4Fe-4S binding protein n=1 Tax=Escherichia coli TaxID=562 RepID=UPI0035D80357